ncbi:Transcription elongation factor SPT4 [Acropora cervicornis]|uniref:Transcription elongation factor SPT4 n=1 Tax=Acropora cervicornis TaxID=6130 RepID=A0AAD9UZZ6_ACRCE|nr:Transcription elongation factor SPT4 [Acropora cervicornis]
MRADACNNMESVPKELRNLRACLLCSLVKTMDQFEYDGCENCEKFLRLKNNKENILTCTNTLARGCYAISVSGKLPGHVVRDLKARGMSYKSRDRTNHSSLLPEDAHHENKLNCTDGYERYFGHGINFLVND